MRLRGPKSQKFPLRAALPGFEKTKDHTWPDAVEQLGALGADAGGDEESALLVERNSTTVERTAEEVAAEAHLTQCAAGGSSAAAE